MSHNEDNGSEGQELPEECAEIDDPDREDSSSSSRRTEANRKNALKSTGPRTPEGKARSSQNAIKHGAFVASLAMISKGVFREDEEAFDAQVQALLDSLEPRDAIESAVAMRITGLFINCDRLDTWSNFAYEGASTMSDIDDMVVAGSWYPKYIAAERVGLLVSYLEGQVPEKDFRYSTFATFLRNFGPRRGVKIKDLWDEEHEPKTNAEWKRAFETLKKHFWPDPSDAHRWALDLAQKLTREAEAVEGKAEQIAANRILHGPLDLHLKYFGRIRRELTELLKLYTELRKRPLPSPGKNEPNNPEAPQVAI